MIIFLSWIFSPAYSIIKEMKFAMKEVRHERKNNGNNNDGKAGGTYYRHVPPHDGPSHPLVPWSRAPARFWKGAQCHGLRLEADTKGGSSSFGGAISFPWTREAVPLSSPGFPKKSSFLFWTPSQKAGLPRTASGFREWSFPTASMMRNGATILHGPGSLPLKRTPLKNFLAWKSIPGWKDWRRL